MATPYRKVDYLISHGNINSKKIRSLLVKAKGQSKASILSRFDVTVISTYFPAFERELGHYL
jgi:hypothetical protein